MRRVVVVMPSGSRIEITGSIEKVECLERVDPEGEHWRVSELPERCMREGEVGLSEVQQPDGSWVKAVGKPLPRPLGGRFDPRDKVKGAS